jgi:hypothetical protein
MFSRRSLLKGIIGAAALAAFTAPVTVFQTPNFKATSFNGWAGHPRVAAAGPGRERRDDGNRIEGMA